MSPEKPNGTHVDKRVHPGMIPVDKGGERPDVPGQDHIPLEDAVEQYMGEDGTYKVPENVSPLLNSNGEDKTPPFTATPTFEGDSKPEHTHRRLSIVVGAGLAAVAVAAGGFFGVKAMSGNDHHTTPHKDPKPTSEPSATTAPTEKPTTTPAPAETTAPTPEATTPPVETMPSSLAPLAAESPDAFNSEPKPAQLSYLAWQNRDIKTYADQYAALTNNPNEKYPDSISINNTPQEILTSNAMSIQHAFSMETADEAKKAVIASLRFGEDSDAYPIWETAIDKEGLNYTPLDAKFFAVTGQIEQSTATGASDLQTDLTGERYKDITFTYTDTTDGSTIKSATVRFYYVEFKDANGQEQAMWLRN